MVADYSGIYDAAGQKYNVDPLLLQAIAQHESGQQTFDAQGRVLTSSAGAGGIMQFMPETAKTYGVNVADPVSSIMGGAHYISDLLRANKGNVVAALSQYGGYSNPQQAMQYAQSVAGNYTKLQASQRPQPQSQAGPPPDPLEALRNPPPAASQPPPQGPAAPPPQQSADPLEGLRAPAQAAPAPPPSQGIQVPGRSPSPVTPPPVQNAPSNFQAEVVQPIQAMLDPRTVPPGQTPPLLAGSPALTAIGAGGIQGQRNLLQSASQGLDWLEQPGRAPWLRSIDRPIGSQPLTTADLAAQHAAEQRQYGGSNAASAAEFVSPLLTTWPLMGGIGAATRAGVATGGEALLGPAGTAAATQLMPRTASVLGRAIPAAAEGATTGGLTNMLTNPDQDPLSALQTGAIGGAAIAGPLGGMIKDTGPVNAMAKRLGFNLSSGEQGNWMAKNIEDLSALQAPGLSGAAAKEAEHRANMATLIGKQIGEAPDPGGEVSIATLKRAEDNAGNLMDKAKGFSVNGNTDQTFLNTLANLHADATRSVKPSVVNQIDHVFDIMNNNGGTLPGTDLHDLISKGGVLDRMINGASDMGEKYYGVQIKNALLDAAERDATNRGSPDFADFQQGRQFWKAIKTVEDPIGQSPSGSTDTMSWDALKRSIYNHYDMLHTGAGNDMQDLARVIRGPLAKMQQSGTGRQLMWQRLLLPGGELGAAGAAAYLAPQYILPAAGGLAGLTAAGRLSRMGVGGGAQAPNQLLSRAGAGWVGNRLNALTGQTNP